MSSFRIKHSLFIRIAGFPKSCIGKSEYTEKVDIALVLALLIKRRQLCQFVLYPNYPTLSIYHYNTIVLYCKCSNSVSNLC